MTELLSEQNAYQQKLNAQLKQIRAVLSQRKAEVEELVADQRIAASKKLKQLEQQLTLAEGTRDSLASSSQDAWKELQKKKKKAVTKLQQGLQELTDQFDLEAAESESE